MATWIAHLRVAESVHARLPQAQFDQFLAGSIAPDAGTATPDGRSYSSPQDVSHYLDARRPRWRYADLRFVCDYTDGLAPLAPDRCFLLGYFCHLLLDNLWSHYVWRPAKALAGGVPTHDPVFIREVKRDWYAIDHIYLRDHPRWPTWDVFCRTTCRCDKLPHYAAATITDKIRAIRDTYEGQGQPILQARYLSVDRMDAFVDLASRITVAAIENLDLRVSDGAASALDVLVRRHRFLDSPVGDLESDRDRLM